LLVSAHSLQRKLALLPLLFVGLELSFFGFFIIIDLFDLADFFVAGGTDPASDFGAETSV
jgi:hypothetical protein